MMVKIAPSILSADFSRLGEEVERLQKAGADWIHVDVMDGNFVPNITIGPGVIEHIRRYSNLPFDVHLMIAEPGRYIEQFSKAGADIITIHVEACSDVESVISKIKKLGKKAGLSINPETPLSAVLPYLDSIDVLLIMAVRPGFGGQTFMPEVLPKIKEARRIVDERDLKVEIEVDGGVNCETAVRAAEAGADVLAAGSALFKCTNLSEEINDWRFRCSP